MSRRKSHKSDKPPGQRQLRMGEQIRHVLSEVLREGKFRDTDLANAERITITAVELGPDLKHAHCFSMPLGGENADKIIEALNRAAAYLRNELAARMDLRYTPKLSFKIDKSFDASDNIDRLLRANRKEIKEEDAD